MPGLLFSQIAALLCSTALCASALAQGETAAQPTGAPSAPAESDALQGPAVKQSNRPASIVQHDAAGRLRPLSTSPEEAAIALLGVDAGTGEKVKDLVNARRALVDRAVRENIDVLLEIQSARAMHDREKQVDSLKTLLDRAPGLKELFQFRQSLIDALPPAKATQARAMLDEYWDAFVADLQDSPQATGMSHEQVFQVEILKALGEEIRQSYERIAQFNKAQLEEAIQAVDATPEQEQKIRAIATEFAQKTKLNASKQARIRLFQEVAKVLTHEQVVKLLEFRQGRLASPSEPPHPAPDPGDDAQIPAKPD